MGECGELWGTLRQGEVSLMLRIAVKYQYVCHQFMLHRVNQNPKKVKESLSLNWDWKLGKCTEILIQQNNRGHEVEVETFTISEWLFSWVQATRSRHERPTKVAAHKVQLERWISPHFLRTVLTSFPVIFSKKTTQSHQLYNVFCSSKVKILESSKPQRLIIPNKYN